MKKVFFFIFLLLYLSGCSGKEAYTMIMNWKKYQSNLTLKNISISKELNVSYLENDIQSDKTLVLVHGFGANKDHWLDLANQLDNKYHLIIPDLIGDGESSKPLHINYSVENQTTMLHQFLSKFQNKQIVLVGNSMGGLISLNYAYKYQINALVLIDSLGLEVQDAYLNELGVNKAKKLYLDICSVEKMHSLIELVFAKPPYIPEFIVEYLTKEKCQLSKLDEHKLSALFDNNLNLIDNIQAKSTQIKTPTLILWGEKDKIVHVKNAYAFHTNIKNSELVIFENLGHIPMMEDPKSISQSIISFLDQ